MTPDGAFRHWVDADERRRWYQGDEPDWVVDAATDLRVGGRNYVHWGPTPEQVYQEEEEDIFEVVDPPNRLVYTSRFTPIAADEGGAQGPYSVSVRSARPRQDAKLGNASDRPNRSRSRSLFGDLLGALIRQPLALVLKVLHVKVEVGPDDVAFSLLRHWLAPF